MIKDNIMNMLQTLCMYNNVEIKHTFSLKDEPVLTVRCLKDTNIIELNNHFDNSVTLYEDLEEAAEALQFLISEIPCNTTSYRLSEK